MNFRIYDSPSNLLLVIPTIISSFVDLLLLHLLKCLHHHRFSPLVQFDHLECLGNFIFLGLLAFHLIMLNFDTFIQHGTISSFNTSTAFLKVVTTLVILVRKLVFLFLAQGVTCLVIDGICLGVESCVQGVVESASNTTLGLSKDVGLLFERNFMINSSFLLFITRFQSNRIRAFSKLRLLPSPIHHFLLKGSLGVFINWLKHSLIRIEKTNLTPSIEGISLNLT